MQEVIDAYFTIADRPTISGLTLALGFTSRQSLLNYAGYGPEFLFTIARARLRIEMHYEQMLVDPTVNSAAVIFALKRLGWRDKLEPAVTDLPTMRVVYSTSEPADTPVSRARSQAPSQVSGGA